MPIYEFACPKCRKVYSFLSKRVAPSHTPACPKCGSKRLTKEISRFAFLNGAPEPAATGDGGEGIDPSGEPGMEEAGMPNMDDPRIARAMSEMERDMDHLDENNPKHMAHLLRKMKGHPPFGIRAQGFRSGPQTPRSRRRSRKSKPTWATCSATSWAAKTAPAEAAEVAVTPKTQACTITNACGIAD